jgi:hypothetical protein
MATLCPFCFSDPSFRRRLQELRPKFPRNLKCDVHPTRSGLPPDAIAPLVDAVISRNYVIGEYSRSFSNDEDDKGHWEQNGEPLVDIVNELTGAQDDNIAQTLVDQLIDDDPVDPRDGGDSFYHVDQSYVRVQNGSNSRSEAWEQFKVEIVYNRRFFSDLARDRLNQIFADIHLQKDNMGNPVVYTLQPDDETRFYRVRDIDSPTERADALADPANKLGSPPKRFRSPGRMNAAGVPAFYGAFEVDTCVAEIRPSVGSTIVGAAFRAIRPLVVLDTTRFARPIKVRSLFSPVYNDRLEQWSFMQSFMHEISRPVLPDDTLLDYIPTQAVAEYLNSVLKVTIGKVERGIDAIIFASAQAPSGRNIVFFGDAAIVENSEPSSERTSAEVDEAVTGGWTPWNLAPPNAGLTLLPDTVFVGEIRGVQFTHVAKYAPGVDHELGGMSTNLS